MAKYEHHIFVCVNERPEGHPRGCCKDKGAEDVRARFKSELRSRGLKDTVRANRAYCLDQCALGVTVVIYPEQIWYGGVRAEDVPEILDAMDRGEVVERLRLPDEVINTDRARWGDRKPTD